MQHFSSTIPKEKIFFFEAAFLISNWKKCKDIALETNLRKHFIINILKRT